MPNKSNKHYIQIFIEERGTTYYKENEESKSLAGHMWFQLSEYDENNNQVGELINAGYTSKGIVDNDDTAYKGKSACESQRLEITQEAYNELVNFAQKSGKDEKPKENPYAKTQGFGLDDYEVFLNSCIDYVWKALEIAGYNETKFEGKLVPMKNCEKIQQIKSIPKDNKIITFNRLDLLYRFALFLNQNQFYFDFNINEDNKNEILDTSSPSNSPLFQESLPPNTINSHRQGTIKFNIQVLDEYTRTPIKNTKLQLQNINGGVIPNAYSGSLSLEGKVIN